MKSSRPPLTQESHRSWPPRTGESYKDGKYYHFDQREILVMTSWPDPRAWRRTKTIDWKRTRKHADQALNLFDMTLPEQSPVDHFVNQFRPDPRWDQSQSGPDKAKVICAHMSVIFAHMSASVRKVEDVFDTDFPWPAEITEQERNCNKGAANSQLVRTSYLRHIPETVRALLHPLRERRWQMLNLLARCPGALDLGVSNPGLTFALANNWCFHRPSVLQPYRAARHLVHKKQRDIAGWLGFPAEQSVVRILAKIVPESLSISRLCFLKRTLTDPVTRKFLAHLPAINSGVLALANSPTFRPRLSYALLREISGLDMSEGNLWDVIDDPFNYQKLMGLIRDTRYLTNILQGQMHWPDRFHSISDLQDFHDHASKEINALRLDEVTNVPQQNLPFPQPPFVGTDDITPITTARDLFEEGQHMNHCVGSYIQAVSAGKIYAYRVTSPVRATLSIRRKRGREWIEDQVASYANQAISPQERSRLYSILFAT